jgi:hypothetical protein
MAAGFPGAARAASLEELVCTADAIVIASVTAVDDAGFTAVTKTVLFGVPGDSPFAVMLETAPTTAADAPHAGDQAILFLVRPADPTRPQARWPLAGPPGVAYLLIDGDHVVVREWPGSKVAPSPVPFRGDTVFGFRFPLADLEDAVRRFRSLFYVQRQRTRKGFNYVSGLVIVATPKEVDAYKGASLAHRYLVESGMRLRKTLDSPEKPH